MTPFAVRPARDHVATSASAGVSHPPLRPPESDSGRARRRRAGGADQLPDRLSRLDLVNHWCIGGSGDCHKAWPALVGRANGVELVGAVAAAVGGIPDRHAISPSQAVTVT